MRVLFSLRAVNYDRHMEAVLRELLGRGHSIHLAFDVVKRGRMADTALLEAIRAVHPALSWDRAPERRRAWEDFATNLRLGLDYLRYLEPAFASAPSLRQRAEHRAPLPVVRLVRSGRIRPETLTRMLAAVERRLPVDPAIAADLAARRPDLVLVSPLIDLGSGQGDYLRAADAAGVPTAVLVASWDNLTNKGRIRDVPGLTVVWNKAQVAEAVELHGLPRGQVAALGAHTYDHWFGWRPSTDRAAFCATVGLDPDRPIVLYTGSSPFVAADEANFAARWLAALRRAPDPGVREAGVLFRPHPANAAAWEHARLDGEQTVVWPPRGAVPTSREAKAAYFDSLFHSAAVVGINTSALVEAAIVGRPVLTPQVDEFRETQQGTLHFAHLTEQRGGPLIVDDTMDAHLGSLARSLEEGPEAHARRLRPFVASFLRPNGLDRPVAPLVADALEALAADPPATPAPVRTAAALGPAVALRYAVKHARLKTGRGRRPLRAVGDSRGRGLRILVALDHPGLLIHFDETLRRLAAEGHRVTLVLGRRKFSTALDALAGEDGIEVLDDPVPTRADRYLQAARILRASVDFIFYLQPGTEDAEFARAKWSSNPGLPVGFVRLARERQLGASAYGRLRRLCAVLEDAIPSDRGTERWLARARPDVVLVSPLVQQDAYQTDVVKSARALGLPTVLCVASWDNLTSKGEIRIPPDLVTVWNEAQRREAESLHGVPPARVRVTGAQPYDRWFGRAPSRTREDICRAFGLPADRPYVLFVGSTRQRRNPRAEPDFVRAWLSAVRSADDAVLRSASVLVRPHPANTEAWGDADIGEQGPAAVWRREAHMPVDEHERSAYYDALFHSAAVVGINTSAMLEAAVVGRPVQTVLLPEWRDMQESLLHFRPLLAGEGGFLLEHRDLETHVRSLAADLGDPTEAIARQRRFVARHVRPLGWDRAATPELVAAIVAAGRGARPGPAPLRPLLWALRPALVAGAAVLRVDVQRRDLRARARRAARVAIGRGVIAARSTRSGAVVLDAVRAMINRRRGVAPSPPPAQETETSGRPRASTTA